MVSLQEPALGEKDVLLLEENIDDPIGAVKKLGRVSLTLNTEKH